MAGALQFCDQIGVRQSRLLELNLGNALSLGEVCVDLLLVAQIECKRSMDLLQAEGRL